MAERPLEVLNRLLHDERQSFEIEAGPGQTKQLRLPDARRKRYTHWNVVTRPLGNLQLHG